MSKQLHFISCVEDSERFLWESAVQLFNMEKYGLDDKFRIIIFLPAYNRIKGFSPKWKKLEEWFPNTKFFYYQDDNRNSVTDLMVNYDYIPIHRLCSLERHFKEYPELEKDAIFYLDSDVIFTKDPNISQELLDNDIIYLSDTRTYLNERYFSSKIKDVKEELKEEYDKLDVVDKIASFAKLKKETLIENNDNTGGAQYILKNMTADFFSKCIDTCLIFRMYLQHINQKYFPGLTPQDRESKGHQSWVADMAAIQWNLWRLGYKCETPSWMDFAWATDDTSKLESTFILHNAGITSNATIRATKNLRSVKNEDGSPLMVDAPAFFKGKYANSSPFNDIEELEKIVAHETSQQYCTSIYTQEVLNTYNKFIKQ